LNDFEKLGGAAHTWLPQIHTNLQEKESSAKRLLDAEEICGKQRRSISRGELRSHAPRAMKLDQGTDAAIAAVW